MARIFLSCITVLALSARAQLAQDPAPTRIADPSAQSQPVGELRYPVALQLSGSWCYGYLSANQDRVRFDVVQPQADSKYSFEAPRAEVAVRQWVLLGLPQDAIELQVKGGATYHMRWLANADEVRTGAARRWTPPPSQPPNELIAAMQDPAAALAQSRRPTETSALEDKSGPAPGANSASPGPAGNLAGSATAAAEGPDVPPGMLAGVYVATAGEDARPSNRQFLFYPDGMVMNGVPQEGMLGFDFNHYRPQDNPTRNWVGRYKVSGDEIKILWMNQFADAANPDRIKRNETSAHPPLEIGWQVFIPMCRCTGKRLSGTYRWGALAADQYLQFFPDGTFIDHRVTDQLIVPSRFYEHPRIQRGTYQIERQTIIFTFADGHRAVRTFLAPKVQENNPTFDWIDLGRQMLFEESYRARGGSSSRPTVCGEMTAPASREGTRDAGLQKPTTCDQICMLAASRVSDQAACTTPSAPDTSCV